MPTLEDLITNAKELQEHFKVEEIKRDKEIVCKDCGITFIFTIKDQEIYEHKGFKAPVRCKECRKAKRRNRRR